MERITNKNIEYQLKILNEKTNNPINVWPYKDNIGNIHTSKQNGYTNIHRTVNEGGGVTKLAGGLTKREAYNWIKAAIKGIELVEESNA
tara:strand:- start:112 stop:378 length:267 start_codon:yes stop_codon:yes gene_type:complete